MKKDAAAGSLIRLIGSSQVGAIVSRQVGQPHQVWPPPAEMFGTGRLSPAIRGLWLNVLPDGSGVCSSPRAGWMPRENAFGKT